MRWRFKLLCIVQSVEHLDIKNTTELLTLIATDLSLVHVTTIKLLCLWWHSIKLIPIDLIVLVWVLPTELIWVEERVLLG